MERVILSLCAALLLMACAGNKTDSAELPNEPTDSSSIGMAADTLTSEEDAPPASADGLFDDFIYSFMRNRSFQMSRIKFPLSCKTDGKDVPIEKAGWKFDPLYSRNDVYTMLFDNEASIEREKDTTVHRIAVEWIYLDKRRVKQYLFDKMRGQWMLTGIDSHSLDKNANKDFFDFYHRFAASESFQQKHIENPFAFKTYDYDNYEEIDGLLDVAQWADYRPDLPHTTVTNINYGQNYSDNGERVLVITSPSAGMSCTLYFKKKNMQWRLVRLDNV